MNGQLFLDWMKALHHSDKAMTFTDFMDFFMDKTYMLKVADNDYVEVIATDIQGCIIVASDAWSEASNQ